MNKPLKIFITGLVSLLLFSVNMGSLRCAPPPDGSGDLQPQANRSDPALGKSSDQSWEDQEQENKNERFKELELLIKQRLLKQYERMETADYQEDNSE
jgi:hypothetical protein